MQARHSHPNKFKDSTDYIKEIFHPDLPYGQGLFLAEVVWEDAKMASVYLHQIEGLIQADTNLNQQRDTYAVIVDGPVMYAFNVGGFPEPQFFLFDIDHYQMLEDKEERFRYVCYACLGGESLPDDILVHVYDQHKKELIEEFYKAAPYQ